MTSEHIFLIYLCYLQNKIENNLWRVKLKYFQFSKTAWNIL